MLNPLKFEKKETRSSSTSVMRWFKVEAVGRVEPSIHRLLFPLTSMLRHHGNQP